MKSAQSCICAQQQNLENQNVHFSESPRFPTVCSANIDNFKNTLLLHFACYQIVMLTVVVYNCCLLLSLVWLFVGFVSVPSFLLLMRYVPNVAKSRRAFLEKLQTAISP